MKKHFKFRPVPADFGDRFPDGDYTVGRGADPRGAAERAADEAAKKAAAAPAIPTKPAPP